MPGRIAAASPSGSETPVLSLLRLSTAWGLPARGTQRPRLTPAAAAPRPAQHLPDCSISIHIPQGLGRTPGAAGRSGSAALQTLLRAGTVGCRAGHSTCPMCYQPAHCVAARSHWPQLPRGHTQCGVRREGCEDRQQSGLSSLEEPTEEEKAPRRHCHMVQAAGQGQQADRTVCSLPRSQAGRAGTCRCSLRTTLHRNKHSLHSRSPPQSRAQPSAL